MLGPYGRSTGQTSKRAVLTRTSAGWVVLSRWKKAIGNKVRREEAGSGLMLRTSAATAPIGATAEVQGRCTLQGGSRIRRSSGNRCGNESCVLCVGDNKTPSEERRQWQPQFGLGCGHVGEIGNCKRAWSGKGEALLWNGQNYEEGAVLGAVYSRQYRKSGHPSKVVAQETGECAFGVGKFMQREQAKEIKQVDPQQLVQGVLRAGLGTGQTVLSRAARLLVVVRARPCVQRLCAKSSLGSAAGLEKRGGCWCTVPPSKVIQSGTKTQPGLFTRWKRLCSRLMHRRHPAQGAMQRAREGWFCV